MLSWVGSIYAWNGVKNIISTEALRWFLRYTEENLMSSPALYIVIIFFMSVGLFTHSGLGGVFDGVLSDGRENCPVRKRNRLWQQHLCQQHISLHMRCWPGGRGISSVE